MNGILETGSLNVCKSLRCSEINRGAVSNKPGRLEELRIDPAFPMVLVVSISGWRAFTDLKADSGTPTRFPRSEEFVTHTPCGVSCWMNSLSKSIVSFLNR